MIFNVNCTALKKDLVSVLKGHIEINIKFTMVSFNILSVYQCEQFEDSIKRMKVKNEWVLKYKKLTYH